MMQRHMRVASAQTRQQWSEQSEKSIQGISAKRAEEQIKPHDIRLHFPQLIEQPKGTQRIVERPAALDRKVLEFGFRGRDLIGKNRETKKWIVAQFLSNVKTILAKPALAGRESGYQTNFHSVSALQFRPRYSM